MFIQRCHLRCLASRRANIALVFYCLQIVVVALIVDWDGLTVWCDVYWFFDGWRHLRKGCWSLCGAYDLLHTGVRFAMALRILYGDLCMTTMLDLLAQSHSSLMHNFLYSLTICLLHYYPRHVSSINMPIFRRKNCIHTASGIFSLELSERSYINIRSTVLLRQHWSKTALISELIPNEFCEVQ